MQGYGYTIGTFLKTTKYAEKFCAKISQINLKLWTKYAAMLQKMLPNQNNKHSPNIVA